MDVISKCKARRDKNCILQRLPESKERNTIESSVVCVELDSVAEPSSSSIMITSRHGVSIDTSARLLVRTREKRPNFLTVSWDLEGVATKQGKVKFSVLFEPNFAMPSHGKFASHPPVHPPPPSAAPWPPPLQPLLSIHIQKMRAIYGFAQCGFPESNSSL
jgi:hypothetical protein